MNKFNDNFTYDDLARAIVAQAVMDYDKSLKTYRRARTAWDNLTAEPKNDKKTRRKKDPVNPVIASTVIANAKMRLDAAVYAVKKLEEFFLTDWFAELVNERIAGDRVITARRNAAGVHYADI